MPAYHSSPEYEHGNSESLGVMLVNLGTPDEPTPAALRRYLGQFLRDPRVVEVPRLIWWLVLHGVILRIRPARSARAYRKIWTEQGSPLLRHSQDIAAALQHQLSVRVAGSVHVRLGMSYGKPSIDTALDQLHADGARRIIVLPLYPQYSGTTTGSVFDAVTAALSRRRWVPELRTINHYHDAPGYIAALAASVRDYWDENGRGEKLLFSFHGLPQANIDRGDPYYCQSLKTARLLAASLELDDGDWLVSFQSRVGRAEWLRPYTDETIVGLASKGTQNVDVLCPGFAADCLETLEEIVLQYGEMFVTSGGARLNYIPALNARDDHVAFLSRLLTKHAGGWPELSPDWSASEAARERDRSRQRALAAGGPR